MEKTIKMEPKVVKKEEAKEKKLSYEELEGIAKQLSMQVQGLSQRLQQQDMELTFRRLDYLFAVVNNTTGVFDDPFVKTCVDEIKEIMTPVKEEEVKNGE